MASERYGNVLPGVIGAIAGALLAPETNWRRLAAIIVSGSGFAIFAAPYACERFGVTSPAGISAAGYLSGMLGHVVLLNLLRYAQTQRWFDQVLGRFLGTAPAPAQPPADLPPSTTSFPQGAEADEDPEPNSGEKPEGKEP